VERSERSGGRDEEPRAVSARTISSNQSRTLIKFLLTRWALAIHIEIPGWSSAISIAIPVTRPMISASWG